ncbi:MAG TPA: hypothetical protein VN653_00455, partial [Anaerolineales bacterium]|nr:hypothetical protein [Anaerolineales bacterium]
MRKTYTRMASLMISVVVTLGNYASVGATAARQPLGSGAPVALTDNSYYVATTGNDANPGTVSAPFKTFARAGSVLQPGSALY